MTLVRKLSTLFLLLFSGCSIVGISGQFSIGGVVCPSNFIPVQGNATFSTPDFCVSKFEMKIVGSSDDTDGSQVYDATWTTESRDIGTPWVNITRDNAIAECAEQGWTLISVAQWMVIARNIESVASNWSGGVVSEAGALINRGHSDDAVEGGGGSCPSSDTKACPASSDDSAGYTGTGNANTEAWGSGAEQKRTHTLTNGQVIWDFAGNVREWVSNDICGNTGSCNGGTATLSPTIPNAGGPFEFTDATKFNADDAVNASHGFNNVNLFAPLDMTMGSANGMGQIEGGNGGAVTRGGDFNDTTLSGVFMAGLNDAATITNTNTGFRCVLLP